MVHKDTSLPSSQAAIPYPNNLSLDLLTYYMAKQYEQPGSSAAHGQPALVGGFWGKALAAARTTRPGGSLPLKFPEASLAVPALSGWSKESTSQR